jgi:hypothetical protein
MLAKKAESFLCQRSYCLRASPTLELDPMLSSLGYFHGPSNTLKLFPSNDNLQLQLTLVHEYTHAFRYQFNPDEEIWLDEGIANFMEYKYSGVWPVSYQTALHAEHQIEWSNSALDFGAQGKGYRGAFFFIAYLYNHFGGDRILRELLMSNLSGWENIASSLQKSLDSTRSTIEPQILSKSSLVRHFAVALWLNDPYSARYGLFQLDPSFEGLSETNMQGFTSQAKKQLTQPTSPLGAKKISIKFSRTLFDFSCTESWALSQIPTLHLDRYEKRLEALGTYEVFICINH